MSPDIVAKLKEMVSRLDVRSLSTQTAALCTVEDAEKKYIFRALNVFVVRRRLEVSLNGGASRYYPLLYDKVADAIYICIWVEDADIDDVMEIVLVRPVTVE